MVTLEVNERLLGNVKSSSHSPHGIRRGALTRMLRNGTPEEIVGDRSNVSWNVLEQQRGW